MLIGVDIGTSGTKAILMRRDGAIVRAHREGYGISTPRPGWAEQDPDAWLEKAVVCIRAVAGGDGATVKGVAFSGQMHGIVLANAEGTPLRDAVIWADSRSHREILQIEEAVGADALRGATLNRVAAGFGLASLMWIRNHEPAVLDGAAYVLCPKDYVRSRLCGEFGQEASDASSTCCLDVKSAAWAWNVIRRLGLPERIFPAVHASADVAGGLTASASARCGLPAGTPLYYGGADNCMAGIGSGIVDDGCVGVNIGTGGQVGTIAAEPYFDPEYRLSTFCHVIPGRWSIYGASLAAGLSLKWYRDAFFPGLEFAALSELAARAKPGSGGLFFLPYLTGERTPWLDPKARGMFWGLSLEHGPAEMTRAVMEGVAYALDQSFSLIRDAGVRPTRLLSLGGGAKSALWPQILADMFGMELRTVAGGDACTGAAIVAGVGAGAYRDVFEGCAAAVGREGTAFVPDPAAVAAYAENKDRFRRIYLHNRELFQERPEGR